MSTNELGFYLPNGNKYFQLETEKGHIEVAMRVINIENLSERFEKSKWNDPVDFLIFDIGAIKIGNRWGSRVISYYPNLLDRKSEEVIAIYKMRHYDEDPVYPPGSHQDIFSCFR